MFERFVFAGMAGMLALAAHAAPPGAEVRLTGWKVVAEPARGADAGADRLEPLQRVQPGDRVEYHATYVNGAAAVARGVQLTIPVPGQGLAWLPPAPGSSAEPAPTLASLDGERFEPLPLLRPHTLPDGRRVLRPVPVADYRYLRWQLGDVPAGATRTVRARMQMAR